MRQHRGRTLLAIILAAVPAMAPAGDFSTPRQAGRDLACQGVPLPALPLPVDPADARLACALRFDAFVAPLIAHCSTWAGRMDDLGHIEAAKQTLIDARIQTEEDFKGVTLRWCPLGNAWGMVPTAETILLHPDAKARPSALAELVAHEMKHVEQYRRWGQTEFKCRYVEEVLKGRGTGRRNSVEREAYEHADKAGAVLEKRTPR